MCAHSPRSRRFFVPKAFPFRGVERPENSPVDCFQRDGDGSLVERWPSAARSEEVVFLRAGAATAPLHLTDAMNGFPTISVILTRCSPSEKAACNPKLLNERGGARCARPRSSLVLVQAAQICVPQQPLRPCGPPPLSRGGKRNDCGHFPSVVGTFRHCIGKTISKSSNQSP